MATPMIAPPRKRRHTRACARCRKRKIRCDFQYPTCGACSAAGVACSGSDPVDGTDKPRSLVRHLEERVARLEMDLAALRNQSSNIASNVTAATDRLTTELAKVTVDPRGSPHKQDSLVPLASKYFLSDSPLPNLNLEPRNGDKSEEGQPQSAPPITISSIPRHVVDAMLKHYCETYRPQYPSIGEADLYRARDEVYQNPQVGEFDIFVIAITVAISSNTLMHVDEKRAATTTSGLWATAVSHLNEVGMTSSWDRLQALQLLTHYGFLNPQAVNVSHCAAAATRLAFQLGLHRELPPLTQTKLDMSILNTRRRMFWNAYAIDAATRTVRRQPFKWSRPEITAKFPDSESPATQTHSAHVWSLREIECDINLRLEYPMLDLEFPDVDPSPDHWYVRIHTRLEQWYQDVRRNATLTARIEFHELLFQIQVLRLNRPSPRYPVPNHEMQRKGIIAAMALIREFCMFDQLGKMFMLWHAAHCVIEAGTYLLSSVLVGIESHPDDRIQVCGEDVAAVLRHIKTIPSLVWKIARRWPSIKQYGSALEAICNSTLDILQRWSDGQDGWQSKASMAQEELGQLTLSQSTYIQEEAWNTTQGPTTSTHSTRGATASHLTARTGPDFGYPAVRMSAAEEPASTGPGWLDNQKALDNSLPALQENYSFDFGDPLMWNFDGLDSEEIFAALLAEGEPDTVMLQ